MMKRFLTFILATLILFTFTACGNADKNASASDLPETEAETEYQITPCTADEAADFQKALVGSWSSYTRDGIGYTYEFDGNGGVRYQKDGNDAEDFTYTFDDDRLTITTDKKSFVYPCSKDAVDMMTDLHDGEWQQVYSDIGKTITDFNGCAYFDGDILYLGSVCLCRADKLDGCDEKSLEGEWIGAIGDTIRFGSDGSYLYIDHATEYNGTYTVDFENNKLSLKVGDHLTDYSEMMWGLDGRVFHIGTQYYFKAN